MAQMLGEKHESLTLFGGDKYVSSLLSSGRHHSAATSVYSCQWSF